MMDWKHKIAEAIPYINPIVICAILFIVGYNVELFGSDNEMCGYMCMSIYVGSKIVDQFLPTLFVLFNMRAIFWYYLIRIVIALFI